PARAAAWPYTSLFRSNMVAGPGELLVVYFGYLSCPDVCPTTMADLKSAFTNLPPEDVERIDVAFVTVDPERDDGDSIDSYMDYLDRKSTRLNSSHVKS